MGNDIVIHKSATAVASTAGKPIVPGARRLTPLQMNTYHFADRPTVLTPDRLRKAGK